MRIGVSGKGGVGKTTIAAVLARSLAHGGRPVVAVDCDSDPNLAMGLGVDEEQAAGMRALLDQSGPQRQLPPDDLGAAALVDGYGLTTPGNVTVLLGAQAQRAGSG